MQAHPRVRSKPSCDQGLPAALGCSDGGEYHSAARTATGYLIQAAVAANPLKGLCPPSPRLPHLPRFLSCDRRQEQRNRQEKRAVLTPLPCPQNRIGRRYVFRTALGRPAGPREGIRFSSVVHRSRGSLPQGTAMNNAPGPILSRWARPQRQPSDLGALVVCGRPPGATRVSADVDSRAVLTAPWPIT